MGSTLDFTAGQLRQQHKVFPRVSTKAPGLDVGVAFAGVALIAGLQKRHSSLSFAYILLQSRHCWVVSVHRQAKQLTAWAT